MLRNAKPGENVFKTTDAIVRKYWKKHGGEKVHDIRSYVATETAKAELNSMIPQKPANEMEYHKLQMDVAKVAARKLGNRPEESLSTYINPSIFKVVLWVNTSLPNGTRTRKILCQ